jgi:hypothetical protein
VAERLFAVTMNLRCTLESRLLHAVGPYCHRCNIQTRTLVVGSYIGQLLTSRLRHINQIIGILDKDSLKGTVGTA